MICTRMRFQVIAACNVFGALAMIILATPVNAGLVVTPTPFLTNVVEGQAGTIVFHVTNDGFLPVTVTSNSVLVERFIRGDFSDSIDFPTISGGANGDLILPFGHDDFQVDFTTPPPDTNEPFDFGTDKVFFEVAAKDLLGASYDGEGVAFVNVLDTPEPSSLTLAISGIVCSLVYYCLRIGFAIACNRRRRCVTGVVRA